MTTFGADNLGSGTLQPTAEDRATEFSAISGQSSDHYNGYNLMVAAYAAIWLIMLVWLGSLWRTHVWRPRATRASLSVP